ncbi:MAG: MarR family transcriptional regulator [Clostridia bacterium]|nr:MarR family transcriptional regulator [Clostridia bacterium]
MKEKIPYGRKIKALNRAFHQAANVSFASLELTCTQGMFLTFLDHHRDRPVYPKDLEQFFELSHPTVSGLLSRMEAKGFILITPDTNDRRCKRITLTEKAHDAIKRGLAQMEQLDEQLVFGFTEEEKNQFWSLLCRAAENAANPCNPLQKEEDHA